MNNWDYLSFGVAFNALICALLYFFIPFPASIPACLASLAYFGYLGRHQIKIAHAGVATFFGARMEFFLPTLKEGDFWVLPWPFMGYEEVDVREKPQDIETVEELSSDNIPVTVNAAIQRKVVDLHKYIDTDNAEEALNELVQRTIRWYIRQHKAKEMPAAKEDLAKEIEKEADKVSRKRWGLDIVQIFLKSIRLPEALEKALTEKEIEKAERSAEIYEINTLIQLIERMNKKTDDSVTDKDILNAVQVERGKTTKILVEGSAGDFTKAAALTAFAGNKKGGKKK